MCQSFLPYCPQERKKWKAVILYTQLKINSKNLVVDVFYKFTYLGDELVLQKSSDGKIKIFEVVLK
jgi:hypothetical protein